MAELIELKLLHWISVRKDDEKWRVAALREVNPEYTSQRINNHLKRWIDRGALQREGHGLYSIADRELLMDIYESYLKKQEPLRPIKPNFFLTDEEAEQLNETLQLIRYFVWTRHPLGKVMRDRMDKHMNEATEAITSVRKHLRAPMRKAEAKPIYDRLNISEVESLVKKYFPDTYEGQMEHWRNLMGELDKKEKE